MKKAPWTPEEVDSLNGYQESGAFHPFTCGTDDCRHNLVATEKGWICPKCPYTQDWAHEFMMNDSWKPSAEMLKTAVPGESLVLDFIKDRYFLYNMKYPKKVVGHQSDCQIYRSLQVYKHATCTCGLLDDLKHLFNISIAKKLYPAWEYDLYRQEESSPLSVEDWRERCKIRLHEVSELPEISWLTPELLSKEDTEERDRAEWKLIDWCFGETDLRRRYEAEGHEYQI